MIDYINVSEKSIPTLSTDNIKDLTTEITF